MNLMIEWHNWSNYNQQYFYIYTARWETCSFYNVCPLEMQVLDHYVFASFPFLCSLQEGWIRQPLRVPSHPELSMIPPKMGGMTFTLKCKVSVIQLPVRRSARENKTSIGTKGREKWRLLLPHGVPGVCEDQGFLPQDHGDKGRERREEMTERQETSWREWQKRQVLSMFSTSWMMA